MENSSRNNSLTRVLRLKLLLAVALVIFDQLNLDLDEGQEELDVLSNFIKDRDVLYDMSCMHAIDPQSTRGRVLDYVVKHMGRARTADVKRVQSGEKSSEGKGDDSELDNLFSDLEKKSTTKPETPEKKEKQVDVQPPSPQMNEAEAMKNFISEMSKGYGLT